MRIYRIFVESRLRAGDELELSERAANHLVRVLRHRVGDRVTLFDGTGVEAAAEITAAHRRHGCRVRVIEAAEVSHESKLAIELLPGLSRGEKMDWVIQKSVELGVSSIRPVITARSEVRPGPDTARRVARWHEIMIGACEQSGRTRLAEIHPPVPLEQLETQASTRLALDPEATTGLADCRPAGDSIAIAVGPEGGFCDQDLALLTDRGFRRVRFGPRVLRTETAGIAAVTALQVLYGDLGGPN
ncbi:MAG: 16S rRNA (uracil(1498)-N(3))-methyltransferase [Wenzhouxiangellaceae bacterium]